MLRIAGICLLLFCGSQAFAGEDALDELNAQRAARGLRPYIRDAGLTAGAIQCADHRAKWLCAGHTVCDFSALPIGVTARAAGCAAWPIGQGFGACCAYENWTYAGAAWTLGKDGRRYCQLFVR